MSNRAIWISRMLAAPPLSITQADETVYRGEVHPSVVWDQAPGIVER